MKFLTEVRELKWKDKVGSHFLEVEKKENSILFFMAEIGEEQVGQYVEIPLSEINTLIKYLQSNLLHQ